MLILHAGLPIDTSAQRNGDHPFSANDDAFEPHCRLGASSQRNGDHLFSADDDAFEPPGWAPDRHVSESKRTKQRWAWDRATVHTFRIE